MVDSRVNFDEPSWRVGQSVKDYMRKCLNLKWNGALEVVSSTQNLKHLIVVADTMVALNDELLGKPKNKKDAFNMLSRLSDNRHRVYTAYKWGFKNGTQLLFSKSSIVKSTVEFRKLSSSEIKKYISCGEPMDKAGSYAFQGLGLNFVRACEGSYANIMGFPIFEFFNDLKKHNILS
jgi:septum formation protein